MAERKWFAGWTMVGVGSFCYGLGISPMYYSWGFFLPEMRQDIAMTETESGLVFSVFSYAYHLLGPVVGLAMGRWGIRSMVSLGSVLAVLAFWLMSRADSFGDCLFAYGILGGIAIGFSTILPAQNLASNWFVKYRARALALVLGGGAVVGFMVNKYFAPLIVEHWTWRTGWLVIAGISGVVAVVAALAIRSTPEEMGLQPDGGPPVDGGGRGQSSSGGNGEVGSSSEDRSAAARPSQALGGEGGEECEWTARQAMRSYQFYALVGLAVAYGVPWGIISVYGRLHLEALGFTTAMAGSILGARVLVSLLGRLSALAGDFVSPQRLLGAVLLLEGLGSVGLVYADTAVVAYFCVILVGLGFGAAYVCIPVAYSSFYGRRAFGATVGARFAITGLISPAAPTVAGLLADWSGSYSLAFFSMGAICLVGALVSFWLPTPGPAPRAVLSPA